MCMIKKKEKWYQKSPKVCKYVSALPKILNGSSLLTWWSAISSIIFGPFRLLGNAHLFDLLFRWPVGVDMWRQSCRPEVWIRRRVDEKNSTNFESAENVRSFNIVEFECEVRHIPTCTLSDYAIMHNYAIIYMHIILCIIGNLPHYWTY